MQNLLVPINVFMEIPAKIICKARFPCLEHSLLLFVLVPGCGGMAHKSTDDWSSPPLGMCSITQVYGPSSQTQA